MSTPEVIAMENLSDAEIRERVRLRLASERISMRKAALAADLHHMTMFKFLRKERKLMPITKEKLLAWLAAPMRKIARKTIQTKNGSIVITIEAE